MKKLRVVVDTDNLPMRVPVDVTWLLALSMAVWHWPSWLLGIFWFLVGLLWVAWIVSLFSYEQRNPFEPPSGGKQ